MLKKIWKLLSLAFLIQAGALASYGSEPSDVRSIRDSSDSGAAITNSIRYSIDGGSGSSDGSGYRLRGTIGQFDSGSLTGDSVELVGGFWTPAILPVDCIGSEAIFCDGFETGDFSSWNLVVGVK